MIAVKNRVTYLIYSAIIAFMLSSCSLFELDNFDGPDAEVFGAIIDSKTGETVQQEIGTSGDASKIRVIEYGYASPETQEWRIKLNGEYRNNLVFSGNYDIILDRGNFVKLDTLKAYEIRSGSNELNFEVIPNIRIIDAEITKQENLVVAKFKLEYGHDVGKVNELNLFVQADPFASNSHHISKVSTNVSDQDINFANNAAHKEVDFELEFNLDGREGRRLNSGQTYFFRIGAEPVDLGDGVPIRLNYSGAVAIEI